MAKPNTRSVEDVRRNIRKWRLIKEVKQELLAKKVGVTKAAISHIENGKVDITYSRIRQLAQSLDITEEQLLFIDPHTMLVAV
jgi:transcriptional regulator with XRE-family HTH domain